MRKGVKYATGSYGSYAGSCEIPSTLKALLDVTRFQDNAKLEPQKL